MNSKILWFIGNDPARDGDYHTFVVNGLKPSVTGFMMPMLRDVYRYKGVDYLDVLNWLFGVLFKKFPPMRYAVDATRDPTWAELITRKLGEEKTINYKFTIDSKLHLMTIMRNYLVAGYEFPDADELIKSQVVSAEKAEWIREIKHESLREQMKPSVADKISFSDGGKHNDLLHGQALSLKAVFEYTKAHSGFGQHSSLFGFDGAVANLEEETQHDKSMREVTDLMKKKGRGLFDNIDISLKRA